MRITMSDLRVFAVIALVLCGIFYCATINAEVTRPSQAYNDTIWVTTNLDKIVEVVTTSPMTGEEYKNAKVRVQGFGTAMRPITKADLQLLTSGQAKALGIIYKHNELGEIKITKVCAK